MYFRPKCASLDKLVLRFGLSLPLVVKEDLLQIPCSEEVVQEHSWVDVSGSF